MLDRPGPIRLFKMRDLIIRADRHLHGDACAFSGRAFHRCPAAEQPGAFANTGQAESILRDMVWFKTSAVVLDLDDQVLVTDLR